MAIFMPNATVRVTNPDGTVLTGVDPVTANFQRDKRASLPTVAQGRLDGSTNFNPGFQIRIDTPSVFPQIGAVVTLVTYANNPNLNGTDWKLWDEPQVGSLSKSTVMFVQRRGQDE